MTMCKHFIHIFLNQQITEFSIESKFQYKGEPLGFLGKKWV